MSNKISDKPIVQAVDPAAKVLIVQDATQDGVTAPDAQQATIAAIVNALKAAGIHTGYATTQDMQTALQNSMSGFVADVEQTDSGIKVTFGNGEDQDIPIQAGGLAFDGGEVIQDDGKYYLHLTYNGQDIEGFEPIEIPATGGGGTEAETVVRITNRLSSRSFSIMHGDTVNMDYSWTSVDASDGVTPTGNGSASWYVGSSRVAVQSNIAQGNQRFDITTYLTKGIENTVKLIIEDTYGTTKTFTWTVNVIELGLKWNLSDIGDHGSSSQLISLEPNGSGAKNLHVTLDGDEILNTTVTASGRTVNVTVPAQTHGAHVILAWFTITKDGETIPSQILRHVGIWRAANDSTPIVALYQSALSVTQYGTVTLDYLVYNPSSETASVSLKIGGSTVSTVSVGRTVQHWAYRPLASGSITMAVQCGAVSASCTLTVAPIGSGIAPVSTGLVLDIDPSGHSNAETNRAQFGYTDGEGTNHPFTFSNNFDWTNGGFKQDSDGITAFVIPRGHYVIADCSLFADNAKVTGKEIKIVFKATKCRNYDAELLRCLADNTGIRLQAQQATYSSALESATVQYCEDRKIELDINIQDETDNKLAMAWLSGIPSRVFVYKASDSWTQSSQNAELLKIGSDDCDVWLYRMKMYGRSLTRFEILDNFIADCSDPVEMIARYDRNNIYTQGGEIDRTALATVMPKLRVIHIRADRMTTSKDDAVTCDVEIIYNHGGESHHLIAQGVTMKAQGTSSLEYILAALNLDLDFGDATSWVDGNGTDLSGTGYAMTSDSIPVKYFNIKLNVASSENANNVLLADDYNLFQPDKTSERLANSKVRDTIEGHPCAVFFTNTSGAPITVGARTVPVNGTIMYGIGDMNNSKKNFAVFGQTGDHPLQCCVEIGNNNNAPCRFMSDDLTNETWSTKTGNFEFRYPKTGTQEMKAKWQEVLSWVVSTNPAAATNATLANAATYGDNTYIVDSAAYRRAKFKAEVGNYFRVNSLLYHYLFTERHGMVDNRAKNCFVSYEWYDDIQDYRWNFNKDYDNDTADGNDNVGGLTFTYGLEDTDRVGSQDVFNAKDSVLWCNVRDLLGPELEAMFKSREAAGAWNAQRILAKFREYQETRPEALWIEDAWGKYISPYTDANADRFLKMMLGTKADQRAQYETYQEKYMSSKYSGSAATSDAITLRFSSEEDAYQNVVQVGDMRIKPYSDMYIIVQYGNAGTVKVRATRNQYYDIDCPADTLKDTEVDIYCASNLIEIGSLSAMYPKEVDLSKAKKLQKAEIGSGAVGYENASLTSITFQNNDLLEYIDIRGASALAQELDLTALTSLKELYAGSSGITGYTFAQGAPLEKAYLNAPRSLVALGLIHLLEGHFSMDGTNLQFIRVENSPVIDTYNIVSLATGLTRGRLTGVDWTCDNPDVILRLAGIAGFDASGQQTDHFVLTGAAYVEDISQLDINAISAVFPAASLTITYGNLVAVHTVTFVNYDGTTVLHTVQVRHGGSVVNPVTAGTIQTPVKPSTVGQNFTFIGWDNALRSILDDTTVTAQYSASTRQYTVEWYSGGVLKQSNTVDAYGSCVYTGDTITGSGSALWVGWDADASSVQANMTIHAVFIQPTLPVAVASDYDYAYSDNPEDDSGYTLAELYGIISSGSASSYLSKGDKIKFTTPTNAFVDDEIVFQLIGFHHFKLADGSGDWAETVWHMIGLMNANHRMNATSTNVGGWDECEMRSWLNETIFPALPIPLQALAKLVQVKASIGNTSATIKTSEDKLFLLSQAEVGFDTDAVPYCNEVESGADEVKFTVFTDNASRIRKYYNGTGSATYWWLRSPWASSAANFANVNGGGGSANASGSGNASGAYGVAFGFCI